MDKRHYLRILGALVVVGILIAGFLLFSLVRHLSVVGQSVILPGENQPMTSTIVGALDNLHMINAEVGWAESMHYQDDPIYSTVLRTTDGGLHWKQVTPSQVASGGIDYLYILDETTAWLPGQGGTWYRTTDGGATWKPLRGLQGNVQSFSFSDQNHGWMITQSFSGDTHQKTPLDTTSDGGNTWQQTNTLPFSSIREYHAITEQTGWVTTEAFTAKDVLHSRIALYVTHDAGRTWEQRQLPTPAGLPNTMPSYTFGPTFVTEKDGSLFAAFGQDATHDMYLYVTHDGGKSWQVQGSAVPGYVGVRSVVDDQHIIVDSGTVAGGLQMDLLTLINGQWRQQGTHPTKGDPVEYSFPSASTGVALVRTPSNDLDVYRTNNAGKTWQKIATLPAVS